MVTSSRSLLFFLLVFLKGDCGRKKWNYVLGFLIIPSQKQYLKKSFLLWIACFGLFTKFKNESGVPTGTQKTRSVKNKFGTHFVHNFSVRFSFCNIVSIGQVSISDLRYQAIVFLNFCLDILRRRELWNLSSIIWQEKEGKKIIQIFKYLENKKGFLNEIENHFSQFL